MTGVGELTCEAWMTVTSEEGEYLQESVEGSNETYHSFDSSQLPSFLASLDSMDVALTLI